MIDTYALSASTRRRLAEGPLGPFGARYLAWLESHAYARASICRRLRLVGLFNEWVHSRGMDAGDLDDAIVVEFVHGRRRKGKALRLEAFALRQLVELLREQGWLATPALPVKQAPPCAVLQDFESFLLEERGVKATTAERYVWFTARFLARHHGAGVLGYKDVELSDLTGFLLCVAESAPGQTPHAATALRAFFRFLIARRMLDRNPADGIPRVTTWRLKTLPDRLARPEVDRVLEGQERETPAGKRNYAILLILARLGLRASEVCDLTLEDVDWRAGTILVHGKGGREDRLPLPQEVGLALATYVRDGRPRMATRRLFITATAPRHALSRHGVSLVVRLALRRSGVRRDGGAHLLRHSLASELLHRGASLPEVGQVLRHSLPSSTAIYAKVRIEPLRELALPWPGAGGIS